MATGKRLPPMPAVLLPVPVVGATLSLSAARLSHYVRIWPLACNCALYRGNGSSHFQS
jgi:hypothetical protein